MPPGRTHGIHLPAHVQTNNKIHGGPSMTRLSQALKARNISQRELAKRLGMKATALNYACKNGVKTIRIAIRYAKALSCSWQEVLETPESEAPQ
ncbi:MAG TPA: hypothetical protein DDZ11_05740 [Lentisphaeria bacterium]|nr:hypothetical protein [Lentisphaeria bacterium]